MKPSHTWSHYYEYNFRRTPVIEPRGRSGSRVGQKQASTQARKRLSIMESSGVSAKMVSDSESTSYGIIPMLDLLLRHGRKFEVSSIISDSSPVGSLCKITKSSAVAYGSRKSKAKAR